MATDQPADQAADFNGREEARRLPTGPGVYVMRNGRGDTLYVGKAANLRKRVASYFDARPKIDRIMRMVAQIRQTSGSGFPIGPRWESKLGWAITLRIGSTIITILVNQERC